MIITVSGSVAYDYLMTFPGYFRDHILPEHIESLSLSFLVESMVRQRGGIATNIAYTLALLGGHPRLFATVGEDFEDYRLWLESKGIDTTDARVIPGDYTASFFVNTDRANAQIASFYPGAMARASEFSLHDMSGERPDLLVISPNDPAAMTRYVQESKELGIPYVYDPSQQIVRLSAGDILQGIQGAQALFVNEYEFALIQKHTGLTSDEIIEQAGFVVITRGEQGASIYNNGSVIHVPTVPPRRIVDPTGIGDAFRGGFLSGYSYGLDFETCGQMGALAATYCLEERGTMSHSFTPAEFVSRFRTHFDDNGKLDVLLASSTAVQEG